MRNFFIAHCAFLITHCFSESVAGGLSTSASKDSSDNSNNNSPSNVAEDSTDDSTDQSSSGIELLDRLSDFVKSDTYKTISEIYKHFNDAKSTITETKEKIDKAIEKKTSKFTDSKPDNVNINKTDDLSSQESQPKVTFDGAGSVSLNLGSRNTQSALTNLDASNLSAVNVGAVDKNFTGAWSGAGALNFRGADSGKTSVAMTGAVAVNNVDSTVEANITANKNLTGAINNTVSTTLTDIAGGVGVALKSEVENEGSSEVATSLLRYSPNSLPRE